MSRWLRQSTAQTERIGPFVDGTDGKTEETVLSPGTEISKDGAAFGTGPTGTHDAEGWYSIALTTTHTNTLGSLIIKAQSSGVHLAVWHEFMVLPAVVYDALVLGTDLLDVSVTQWLGAAVAVPSVAGVPEVDVTHWVSDIVPAPDTNGVPEVDVIDWFHEAVPAPAATGVPDVNVTHADDVLGAANKIAAAIGPQSNQAFSDLEFLMVLSSDGQTPATGLTVTGERSIDGAAFAAVSGSIAEVSDGIYQFDAVAADMNGATVTFRFSSATALDTFVTIKTTP